MVPLLKFYFHEEVRRAAVAGILMSYYIVFVHTYFLLLQFLNICAAMPELMRSAKLAVEKGQAQGRDESYVKQLSDYIIPALVEALHKVYLKVSVV